MAVSVSSNPLDYPGFTGEAHPEVFTTAPPQPTEKKPGQLSPEQVKEYFDQGFTVVEGFFTPEEIEPVRQCFDVLVEELAQKLYKGGKIKNLYEDLGLQKRLMMLEKEWPGACALFLSLNKMTPAFSALYQHEKLLNAVEQLIGPEIGASPIWNTRPKVPGNDVTDVPWHQDSAYFDHESYKVLIATAWVAFTDVAEKNGCMQYLRKGHRQGMVGVHKITDTFYLNIDDEELENRFGTNLQTDLVNCPMKAGGVVFFSNMIPHRSIPNVSDEVRWGMDFRYQDPSKPWGFYGTLNGILLRSPSKPDHKPDWSFLGGQDRYDVYMEEEMSEKSKHGKKAADEFNPNLTGPYMDKWPIVTPNKYTNAYFAEKKQREKEEAEKAAAKAEKAYKAEAADGKAETDNK